MQCGPGFSLTSLIWGSCINVKQSAWSQILNQFDFNDTPLAPLGTKVLVHEKPADRDTWTPQATKAWYIGPAMESYCCYLVWVWDTQSDRNSDTISWFLTKLVFPSVTALNRSPPENKILILIHWHLWTF
jgi:hypothetical protein